MKTGNIIGSSSCLSRKFSLEKINIGFGANNEENYLHCQQEIVGHIHVEIAKSRAIPSLDPDEE